MRILATVLLALLAASALAEDKSQSAKAKRIPFDKAVAEKQVRAAVMEFLRAWNTADGAQFSKVLHYPFVTVGREGEVLIVEKQKDYTSDFDSLRKRGWHHSTFDVVQLIAVRRVSAHVRVRFTRRRADKSPIFSAEMLYILTRKDGRWGIQVRSVLGGKRTGMGPPKQNVP